MPEFLSIICQPPHKLSVHAWRQAQSKKFKDVMANSRRRQRGEEHDENEMNCPYTNNTDLSNPLCEGVATHPIGLEGEPPKIPEPQRI